MKMRFNVLLITAVALGVVTGCKKGENDPFLSLKSRKARLAGEWELSSQDISTADRYESGGVVYNSTSSSTFSGGSLTYAWTNSNSLTGSNSGSSVQLYNHTIEFKKDGTFKQVVSGDNDDDNVIESFYTTEGNWAFIGKNKGEDLKNKEAVALFITSETSLNPSGTDMYTYTGFQNGEVLRLDRLAKDELIVIYDDSEVSGTDSYTTTGTKTFEKK